MRRVLIAGAIVSVAAVAAIAAFELTRADRAAVGLDDVRLPSICEDLRVPEARYIVCTVDPRFHDLRVVHNAAAGPETATVADWAAGSGNADLLLAMNAGMYRPDGSPLGLLIEDGDVLSPLDTGAGEGNFYLRPNGVFAVARDGRFLVAETEAFRDEAPPVRFATQSGPLLVQGGQVHSALSPNGASRHIRNGIGVRADGKAVLVISRDPVSLGVFARLFADDLDCPDALYLDGFVSAIADGQGAIAGGAYPAGPMIAVFDRG